MSGAGLAGRWVRVAGTHTVLCACLRHAGPLPREMFLAGGSGCISGTTSTCLPRCCGVGLHCTEAQMCAWLRGKSTML